MDQAALMCFLLSGRVIHTPRLRDGWIWEGDSSRVPCSHNVTALSCIRLVSRAVAIWPRNLQAFIAAQLITAGKAIGSRRSLQSHSPLFILARGKASGATTQPAMGRTWGTGTPQHCAAQPTCAMGTAVSPHTNAPVTKFPMSSPEQGINLQLFSLLYEAAVPNSALLRWGN